LRIIKKKILDDLSNKIKIAEGHVKEIEKINLNKEENEKLQRFGLYQVTRMEKYLRQGGDPTLGNLEASEQTSEEFEYHLSHMLNDYSPEERYNQRKEAYYFHPSYIRMEELSDWKIRANASFCTGTKCIGECRYYSEIGRIEDVEVILEWIEDMEIVEIEDYRRELGETLVDSILTSFNNITKE
jgi:hypothetical protein